jgi:type IV pilus assembly protein PilA
MGIRKIKESGFTLIELMITVAIVGILAAIALPAYEDYTIRAQVSEGILLNERFKPVIEEYYAQNGTFPDPSINNTIGSATGKYSTNSIVAGGNSSTVYVLATFGNQANAKIQGKDLTLMAEKVSGQDNLIWSCKGNSGISSNSVPNKYLPTSCR